MISHPQKIAARFFCTSFPLKPQSLSLILVLPQIVHFEFENPVDANDIAMINCAITKGDPPFEIIWKKDGRKLDSNDGIIILRSGQRLSILNIESAQARHAGNYTCSVKSQAGIIEYNAELHVSGTIFYK